LKFESTLSETNT